MIDHLDDLADARGADRSGSSPVYKMRTEKFFGHGAFHGYWVEDLREVEPRFGDGGALRHALRRAPPARTCGCYLDLVLNHVAPDAPLLKEHPDWFHHEGAIKDWNDPEQLVSRDVMGLPDLAQEKPDGLRLPARRLAAVGGGAARWLPARRGEAHAVRVLARSFNAEIRARAGPRVRAARRRPGRRSQGLSKHRAARATSARCSTSPCTSPWSTSSARTRARRKLGTVLIADRLYPDPDALVTVLDNHDLPRILTDCGGERGEGRGGARSSSSPPAACRRSPTAPRPGSPG